ncbi:hypothetical protein [Actinomadura rugatobispora]|uniref:TROVE domain-containing protein n=1 Tax=Actinomadura rugatobispora TaxID=1994 RepID=A0ABW0ZLS9_9ACTN|nr:TROVE domain-containing protein [Actinomadura rugatobispora]
MIEKPEELFLAALTRLGHADGFFLWKPAARDRFRALVRDATRQDPEWTARFLSWLRTATPMRYVALVGAAAFAHERLAAGQPGMSRQVVDSVLRRADDPGLFLAYWRCAHGRALPKPVKRGISDAVTRLYDERALLAHDTGHADLSVPRSLLTVRTFRHSHEAEPTPAPYRFGDVIELVHPRARDPRQADLYRHALDRRRRSRPEIPASLPLVGRHRRFLDGGLLPVAGDDLGLTWQRASGVLRRPLGADDWERLIPSMSLGDLVRCLTHFDAAGISFEAAMAVASRLADPAAIRAAGLLPLRLAAARKALTHQRWAPLLERAAAHGLATLPRIPGRTLIVFDDTVDDAAVLGLTLAQCCDTADIVTAEGKPFSVVPGESPLHGLHRWRSGDLPGVPLPFEPAVRNAFAGHDRVVIADGYREKLDDLDVPAPVYLWTLNGEPAAPSRDRLVLAGMTDAAYPAIPWAEAAAQGIWPF